MLESAYLLRWSKSQLMRGLLSINHWANQILPHSTAWPIILEQPYFKPCLCSFTVSAVVSWDDLGNPPPPQAPPFISPVPRSNSSGYWPVHLSSTQDRIRVQPQKSTTHPSCFPHHHQGLDSMGGILSLNRPQYPWSTPRQHNGV